MQSATLVPLPTAPRPSVARRAVALARGARASLTSRLPSWAKFKRLVLSASPAGSSATGASRSGSAPSPAPRGASTGNSDRPGAPAARRPGVVWFRADLRLDDNEALARATAECSSVLPVYCFDPRDYGRSPQGYDRTGPYRAAFLIQAVADLRERLRAAGSDLVVRIGKPEEVVAELARRVGAAAVYCNAEVTYEEQATERRVAEAARAAGAQLRAFWTGTLHAVEDLPFKLADMPQAFDRFRAAVAGLAPRRALAPPEALRGLPLGARAAVDAGELPTLKHLGIEPVRGAGNGMDKDEAKGGEGEALRQLRRFLSSAATAAGGNGKQPAPGAAHASSFSSSVAPWLATGCLSPRRMMEEAQRVLGGRQAAGEGAGARAEAGGGAGSLQWVQFELLWRDFFRLLTRRHSEVVLPAARAAVAASAAAEPALAMA